MDAKPQINLKKNLIFRSLEDDQKTRAKDNHTLQSLM